MRPFLLGPIFRWPDGATKPGHDGDPAGKKASRHTIVKSLGGLAEVVRQTTPHGES
jgi:hypothetical protein